jgi:hypothetical protein
MCRATNHPQGVVAPASDDTRFQQNADWIVGSNQGGTLSSSHLFTNAADTTYRLEDLFRGIDDPRFLSHRGEPRRSGGGKGVSNRLGKSGCECLQNA